MTIAGIDDPNVLTGAQVHGTDGDLGKVDSVYFDNATDKPEWVAVTSGLFGSHVSLVPLQQGSWDGRALTVPFDKAAIKNAPHHDPDTAISETDEADLYRHYGMDAGTTSATGRGESAVGDRSAVDDRRDRSGDAGIQGRDTSGPTTDDAMTRSEEQLRVSTERREVGKARLRKHIVTENVSTTVPVSHEEVTLEREPITETNRADALAGKDLSEETHEVTLTAERAVAGKETVPVERVKLGTETVTEQQQVDETLRKEQIEVEGTEGVDVTGDRTTTGRTDRDAGGDRR
ncbi:uncharacterized protein (TIGR02271 family) [Pseudonocardia sediminis]|uniref:Uncharacterized protein (TIGR02271 family) n=1 Tax=Pseudonocardia sediminis TaxID=1397368 RepID=A0A4Q7UZQ5_PSEST|nr:YsnF/AvaK domain-containing protein [Pseudonocardia sediminis]RZT87295.1 uncharacterized protein (TIGR02271 family) [Pseudonocardia sediminis]